MHNGSGDVNILNWSFHLCQSCETIGHIDPNLPMSELQPCIIVMFQELNRPLRNKSLKVHQRNESGKCNSSTIFFFILFLFFFLGEINTIFYETIKVFVEILWLPDTNLFDRTGTWENERNSGEKICLQFSTSLQLPQSLFPTFAFSFANTMAFNNQGTKKLFCIDWHFNLPANKSVQKLF